MKTTKKNFDCVKMKDQAQQRRAQMLRGLSTRQRLDFYRRADAALRERREQLRRANADQQGPSST